MKGQLPDSAVSADAAAAPAVGVAGSVVAAVAAGPTVGCAVGGQPINKKQTINISSESSDISNLHFTANIQIMVQDQVKKYSGETHQ